MDETRSGCSPGVEDTFGPIVRSTCLRGFDFTLLFEEAILTIPPLAIALLWSVQRLIALSGRSRRAFSSWLLPCKLCAYILHGFLHIAMLALWVPSSQARTRLTIPCLCVATTVDLVLASVSFVEHYSSVRPSTLLITYLGITSLLDLTRVRTLFFTTQSRTIAIIFLVGYFVKLATLALECMQKRSMLRPQWENASPEATASILDRMLFFWLNPLFARGFRSTLTVNTLLPLDNELLAASKPFFLDERWFQTHHNSKHFLFWIFVKHYKMAILAGVLPRLANAGFVFAQPYLVQRVLDYTSNTDGSNSNNIADGLIGGYAICYVGIALSESLYQLQTYRLIALFRGSLVSAIFDKTTRIESSALKESEAITLMSADIDRITLSMHVVHELYASVIEVGVALWLLYDILGLAMLPGLAWIALCVLVGGPIANAAGNAQTPWLEAIEVRLAATANALGAMKPIKMTGLTDLVYSRLRSLRQNEIAASLRHRVLNVFVFLSSFASFSLAPILSLVTYELLARRDGETLTQGTAFAALSVFDLLNQPAMYGIHGFEDVQTVLNSFRRIQKYLMSRERLDYRDHTSFRNEKSQGDIDAFVVNNATARYSDNAAPVLESVTCKIPRGQLTALYGPVGSGKSTLLRLLLGEMPTVSGIVTAGQSNAAYCAQAPWLCWGTIRENVVALADWDEKWYERVISACALSSDFERFPAGDETRVAGRGSSLSGGQQTRISLARALYSRSTVMVLDGVLTGLDRNTEQHILEAVFGTNGLLRELGTTVIFSTINNNHLCYADQIVVLDGRSGLAMHSAIGKFAPFEQFSTLSETLDEKGESMLSDARSSEDEAPLEDVLQDLGLLDDPNSVEDRKTGDIQVYGYYASVGGWQMMVLYLLTSAVMVFSVTFPSIWVQWWTNANAKSPSENLGYWAGIYAMLGVLTLLSCLISEGVFNLVILPRTAKRFHELLLRTTTRATTAFFSTTNSGTTLNRFSQDLELIDNDLPDAINTTVFQFLSTIAASILIFIGSGYVAAAIPACVIALILLAMFYLRTSRQMRLLEIEAKAPLFSQFLETIQGIDCIRAFGWTSDYRMRNQLALNTSQRPYYLLFCMQRWLALVLDLFNAGLAIMLVSIATSIRGGSTVYLGTALYNVVIFSTTIQGLVTQWTQVEMSLGAVNRIRSYVRTVEDENRPREESVPGNEWPSSGHVRFNNVTASYGGSDCSPILRNVDLEICPGQKVAICGRTGSGKSSLLATLLRMVNVHAGEIHVDGMDLATLSRQSIRAALNTVPQEPYFLTGSVRENLDPFGTAEDEHLISVLKLIKLWEEVLGSQEGLDAELDETVLSHGQKQLFCLGRALVRTGKLVIMDEATSSIDETTATLMLDIMRNGFREKTVILVAHKLQEVLDFDVVVLLDAGEIVETGNPQELLSDESSLFKKLYDAGEPI